MIVKVDLSLERPVMRLALIQTIIFLQAFAKAVFWYNEIKTRRVDGQREPALACITVVEVRSGRCHLPRPGRSPGDPQGDSNRLNLNRAVGAAFVVELIATHR